MSAPPAITVDEVRALLRSNAVLLDAESPDVWEAKSGTARRLLPDEVSPFLRALTKSTPLVVYSSHLKLDSSALVANAFRQQGFANVKALPGAGESWRKLGLAGRERHVFPSTW